MTKEDKKARAAQEKERKKAGAAQEKERKKLQRCAANHDNQPTDVLLSLHPLNLASEYWHVRLQATCCFGGNAERQQAMCVFIDQLFQVCSGPCRMP